LWIALLAGRVDASLAATSGVETYEEVVKYLLVGADVVMTTSALLRYGPVHIGALLQGLSEWMDGRGFHSVHAMRRRLAFGRLADPEPLLRSQYAEMLIGYEARTE
jgi:dihydroorotate dehydrogenase (fumarate)